jgi:Aspartyl protease
MAALIKVNGLEAYALLDTGSTMISITHDFAHMANLSIIQLENPIALQLGTVGSWSMINFGSRASLEFRLIKDDDAYLDVVNIDRYDMIIGTPFM